jgi:hypothetical protein
MGNPRTIAPGSRAPSSLPRERRRGAAVSAVLLGTAVSAIGAPNAFAAASTAPSHGRTTCALAGDECQKAIAYANAHDGGAARVLAVEADVEAHGGATSRRTFDIRIQTPSGVYAIHILRNDNASSGDAVWWQSKSESQDGATSDPSAAAPHVGTTAGSPADAPRITFAAAAAAATKFATAQGLRVLEVKREKLTAAAPKDYYEVKLQLGANGEKAGTTTIWVDASAPPGSITAAQGSRLDYRDATLIAPALADANAVAAAGGGTAYKTSLQGGTWRWYWVFVRNGRAKDKVGVDAVTGVVTQVRPG